MCMKRGLRSAYYALLALFIVLSCAAIDFTIASGNKESSHLTGQISKTSFNSKNNPVVEEGLLQYEQDDTKEWPQFSSNIPSVFSSFGNIHPFHKRFLPSWGWAPGGRRASSVKQFRESDAEYSGLGGNSMPQSGMSSIAVASNLRNDHGKEIVSEKIISNENLINESPSLLDNLNDYQNDSPMEFPYPESYANDYEKENLVEKTKIPIKLTFSDPENKPNLMVRPKTSYKNSLRSKLTTGSENSIGAMPNSDMSLKSRVLKSTNMLPKTKILNYLKKMYQSPVRMSDIRPNLRGRSKLYSTFLDYPSHAFPNPMIDSSVRFRDASRKSSEKGKT